MPSSNDLKRKKAALSKLNKAIRKLKDTLNDIYDQREKVREEIACIRATNPGTNRIPNEILSYIFEFVLSPEYLHVEDFQVVHQDGTKLRLVCKAWNTLLVNSIHIWKYVAIAVPKVESIGLHTIWARKKLKVLDLCLSRTKNSLLDIAIDFSNMLHGADQAFDLVQDALSGLVAGEMQDWIEDLPWNSCPIKRPYKEMHMALLRSLVGEQGELVERWRTMWLYLPQNDKLDSHIWSLFFANDPRQLGSITLRGTFYDTADLIQRSLTSPTLPRLQELTLLSFQYILALPACPSLRVLVLYIGQTTYNFVYFQALERFPQIRTLKIEGCMSPPTLALPFPRIPLPKLDLLHLEGPFPSGFLQVFSILELSKLKIWEQTNELSSIPIADIYSTAKHIQYQYAKDSKDDIPVVLSKLFRQAHKAHTIEIGVGNFEVARQVVKSCREEGKLRALERLIGCERDGLESIRQDIYVIERTG